MLRNALLKGRPEFVDGCDQLGLRAIVLNDVIGVDAPFLGRRLNCDAAPNVDLVTASFHRSRDTHLLGRFYDDAQPAGTNEI